jgi:5-deoxy-glucuronate isomerase
MPLTPSPASGRLIRPPSSRPSSGLTWLTRERQAGLRLGRHFMDFGLLRLKLGQTQPFKPEGELLFVLLQGKAEVKVAGVPTRVTRTSLFDEGPTAIHCGLGSELSITAHDSDTEWAVLRTSNRRLRATRWYLPGQTSSEDRGAGLAQDACRRTVRTLFDYQSCPDSNLVVGEVVNRAGRWSSYPPHHHPQPEIYHYRFTLPQGYGHAELGDDVVKVKTGDTIEIPGGLDHAQVAAPGYGMYYLWAVRHLPRRPYKGFQFTPAHTWLLNPKHQGWSPRTHPRR